MEKIQSVDSSLSSHYPHPHPLLIDHVLEKLFDYLLKYSELEFGYPKTTRIYPELLACRRVCRKWNEIVLPKILKYFDKTPVVFEYARNTHLKWFQSDWLRMLYSQRVQFGRNQTDSRTGNYITKILLKASHSQRFKMISENIGEYAKYLDTSPEIIFLNISIPKLSSSYTLQKFLRKWGGTLKHLTVQYNASSEKNTDFTKHFPKLIFNQCPNLDGLNLSQIVGTLASGIPEGCEKTSRIKELNVYRSDNEPPEDSILCRDILKACPSLEKLGWIQVSLQFSFEFIPIVLRSKCVATLREIVVGFLSSEHLRIFNDVEELCIRKATFAIDVEDGGREELLKFLQKHQNSLEYLQVTNINRSWCEMFIVLELPDKMSKRKNPEVGIPQNNISTPLGKYPNLRFLELRCFTQTDFELASKVFPNATRLKMGCNCALNMARELTNVWKQLEILDLTFSIEWGLYRSFPCEVILDEILTGNYTGNKVPLKHTLTGLTELRQLHLTTYSGHLFADLAIRIEPVENISVYKERYNMHKLELIGINDIEKTVIVDKQGYQLTEKPSWISYLSSQRGDRRNGVSRRRCHINSEVDIRQASNCT